MDEAQFKRQLREHGYGETEVKTFAPNLDAAMHTHEASVMGLIVSGSFGLELESGTRTFAPGEWFELAANTPHAERTGSQPAVVLLARK